jgi:hypothetical protein
MLSLRVARSCAADRGVQFHTTCRYGFLTRWKDADPDIPILKQARAEYAKLQ